MKESWGAVCNLGRCLQRPAVREHDPESRVPGPVERPPHRWHGQGDRDDPIGKNNQMDRRFGRMNEDENQAFPTMALAPWPIYKVRIGQLHNNGVVTGRISVGDGFKQTNTW